MDNVRFIKAPKATDYFPNANNEAWHADAAEQVYNAIEYLKAHPAPRELKKSLFRNES